MHSKIFAIVFLLSVGVLLWTAARPQPAPRAVLPPGPGHGFFVRLPATGPNGARCYAYTWSKGTPPVSKTVACAAGIDVVTP